jgi:hypothetical protein
MFLIDSETAPFAARTKLSRPKQRADIVAVLARNLVAPLTPMLHSNDKLIRFACTDPETSIG